MIRPPDNIEEQVRLSLAEDLGGGDVTADLVPVGQHSEASVLTREDGVLCGRPWFDMVFRQLDPSVRIEWQVAEGDDILADQLLCRLRGPTRALLSGERTALNWLQSLSATAGVAHAYAEAVAGTGARILDTRKTIPNLRLAQKYAVACGGGSNHRIGLYDAILIKENHIIGAGGITAAVHDSRQRHPSLTVEVEVENLDEFREALAAGADTVLLDNFSLADTRQAVARNAGRARLEVSGGVELARIRDIAETGVDDISIGSLTKHLRALDLSMRISSTAEALN